MRDSGVPAVTYLPTLLIDSNIAGATRLAEQLRKLGFVTDIAITCQAAQAAARARHYRSMILVGELSRAADLFCLSELRKTAMRTWIIVISATAPPQAQQSIVRRDADALLRAPFSMQDLTSRLLAFSLRSRPN